MSAALAAQIQLTRGLVALVDAADLDMLLAYSSWCAVPLRNRRSWRVQGTTPGSGGKRVYMHRLLLPDVPYIDHKNGDGLDNRRENLRPCTNSQNQANRIKHRGTSRFKGVCWIASRQLWRADIKHQGPGILLGHFADEVEAAKAYNDAATRLFGEFARVNRFDEAREDA